jgi:CDP-glucose 4,6-dehydratase
MTARSSFVTGGFGLLGGWLVKALLERGDRVTVLRRDRTAVSAIGLLGLLDDVTIVEGDICDAAVLDRVLGEYDVESVFHLAAQAIVPTANRSPVPTFETNIRGTWTVMDAVRRHEVPRTVVASSDKAYGPHRQLPYREDHALQPVFPYDVSKAATDLLARSYWHTFGVRVGVTRFANLYGGGDLNVSRLVPEVVKAALTGRRPIVRSDGTPERDFLYVEDAAAAYLAIDEALDGDGAAGEAFNAGGGKPVAVGTVVSMVCRLAGTDLEPDIRGTGNPSGEIDRQYVDTTKIRERCGWEPKVDLEDGLVRTIEWYRAHPEVLGS